MFPISAAQYVYLTNIRAYRNDEVFINKTIMQILWSAEYRACGTNILRWHRQIFNPAKNVI